MPPTLILESSKMYKLLFEGMMILNEMHKVTRYSNYT